MWSLPSRMDPLDKAQLHQSVAGRPPSRNSPAHRCSHCLVQDELTSPMLGAKITVKQRGACTAFFAQALIVDIGHHQSAPAPAEISTLLLVARYASCHTNNLNV